MITRKGFCKMILEDACGFYKVSGYTDLIRYIPENTKIGICLQELGILNEYTDSNMYNYVKNRGGIMYAYLDREIVKSDINDPNGCQILTLREFLDLLPESL